MTFCFNAEVSFTSANRRDQVLNALDQNRQGKTRFHPETEQLNASVNKVGTNGIYAILRFVSLADRDAFVAAMLAFATGQFAPVAGSWYRLHDCLHDVVGNCTAGTLVVF